MAKIETLFLTQLAEKSLFDIRVQAPTEFRATLCIWALPFTPVPVEGTDRNLISPFVCRGKGLLSYLFKY